jgi:hypothetical protein
MSWRKLTIEYLPVASLRPDPKNARVHGDRQVQQIAKSIEAFGFNVPILIDANSQVIAGHGRILACTRLGIDEVPVIRLEHLSEHQRRAFMIADNRLTENSEWDKQLLGEQLKILSDAELDFSLEVTAFEMGEIDLMIENLSPAVEGAKDPADAVPEASSLEVSRIGDLWQLGKHYILCGDALSEGSYEALLGDQRANVVFADPPYNVPIAGNVSGKGRNQHREFLMASGEMNDAEFTKFLSNAFTRLATHTLPGSLHYVCMDWRHTKQLGHNPSTSIICASYAQDLADKLAGDCRSLMTSDWYQGLFPSTRLAARRSMLNDYMTTKNGFRLSTSVGGVLTGRGADFIVVDDALKPDAALSETQRNSANDWFDHTVVTRLNDKRSGCIIVIMQRLHESDLVGHVLEQGGWYLLRFPAIAEENEHHTIQTPYGERTFMRREGEALHPERESLELLARMRDSGRI